MPAGHKKGFTLIELLVVIAIIAILAAILFPIYTKAQDAAKKSQCANNMKQIYSGFTMYRDDWNVIGMPNRDGWLAWNQTAKDGYGWSQKIWNYSKNFDFFSCPSRPGINFAYGLNQNITKGEYPTRPSKLILFYECPGSGTGKIIVDPNHPDYIPDSQVVGNRLKRLKWGNVNQNCGPWDGNFHGGSHRMNEDLRDKLEVLDPTDDIKYYWIKDLSNSDGALQGEEFQRRSDQHRMLFFPGSHGGQANLCAYDGHIISASDFQGSQFWTFVK